MLVTVQSVRVLYFIKLVRVSELRHSVLSYGTQRYRKDQIYIFSRTFQHWVLEEGM
jgi:hypothetical protein